MSQFMIYLKHRIPKFDTLLDPLGICVDKTVMCWTVSVLSCLTWSNNIFQLK
jgi:hypothetical protein